LQGFFFPFFHTTYAPGPPFSTVLLSPRALTEVCFAVSCLRHFIHAGYLSPHAVAWRFWVFFGSAFFQFNLFPPSFLCWLSCRHTVFTHPLSPRNPFSPNYPRFFLVPPPSSLFPFFPLPVLPAPRYCPWVFFSKNIRFFTSRLFVTVFSTGPVVPHFSFRGLFLFVYGPNVPSPKNVTTLSGSPTCLHPTSARLRLFNFFEVFGRLFPPHFVSGHPLVRFGPTFPFTSRWSQL